MFCVHPWARPPPIPERCSVDFWPWPACCSPFSSGGLVQARDFAYNLFTHQLHNLFGYAFFFPGLQTLCQVSYPLHPQKLQTLCVQQPPVLLPNKTCFCLPLQSSLGGRYHWLEIYRSPRTPASSHPPLKWPSSLASFSHPVLPAPSFCSGSLTQTISTTP